MRPCVECAHSSDPLVSPKCPECGAEQLPNEWIVLLREPTPWLWRFAHLGSVAFVLLFTLSIIGMVNDRKSPNLGAFMWLGVVCLPISIAHLRGKRLFDIWILGERRLEHRSRLGKVTLIEPEDGWIVHEPRKKSTHPSHPWWYIELERPRKPPIGRPKPTTGRRVAIDVNATRHDPHVIAAAARRALTPA